MRVPFQVYYPDRRRVHEQFGAGHAGCRGAVDRVDGLCVTALEQGVLFGMDGSAKVMPLSITPDKPPENAAPANLPIPSAMLVCDC